MNNKIFIYIAVIIFFSALFCNADDNFYVQSLSAGDDTESNSSITYTNKELPNFNKTADNTNTTQSNQTTASDWYYYPYYYYPYYSTYRIGPYYSRGISVGGYNYTGFAYNYSNGNKVIATPIQRVTVPNIQQNAQPPSNPPANPSNSQQNKT